MLDLRKYQSLGEALRAGVERWPEEICLIEADRERENIRMTYRAFGDAALSVASGLQEAGFQNGTRAAIIMTNQSKWLISAYAIFFSGGVLVPLDYKLTAGEQLQLLAHSKAEFLVVEYYLWRAIAQADGFENLGARVVLVTEAPTGAELFGAKRWEDFRGNGAATFVPRARKDAACIVYSSGTGGRPKGCVLTHRNMTALAASSRELGVVRGDDVVYLYLPLAHVFAQLIQLAFFDASVLFQYPAKIVSPRSRISPTITSRSAHPCTRPIAASTCTHVARGRRGRSCR